MANISILSRLINGVQRNVDLSANTLVVDILKVGGGSGTDLTKTILDTLIGFQARLAATSNGDGASLVGIEDAGSLYTATNVEAALAEVKGQANSTATQSGALVTLSGVASGSTTLGTFTGSIIPDASAIKPALQSLETAIESLPDPMEYKGNWVASTNTPTLADGVGNNGDVYYVTDAGTVDFGAGNIDFAAGDRVVYSGTDSEWQKWDTTDSVSSVNAKVGAVTLVTDDIAEDGSPVNLWFTDGRAKTAAVVNSLGGSQTDQAPSVSAVNAALAALSPGSLTSSEVAGEAFAATTLFAVRWAKAADAGFVAGRVYKADTDASSVDNFHVAGLVRAPGAVSTAGAITLYKAGLMTATSHGFTVGSPIYLSTSGALTGTAPSAANSAVVKVGVAKDANTIDVQIQIMGVA